MRTQISGFEIKEAYWFCNRSVGIVLTQRHGNINEAFIGRSFCDNHHAKVEEIIKNGDRIKNLTLYTIYNFIKGGPGIDQVPPTGEL